MYLPQSWSRPAFDTAVKKLRELGAEVIEIDIDNCEFLMEDDDNYELAMNSEFKSNIKQYLDSLARCAICCSDSACIDNGSVLQ